MEEPTMPQRLHNNEMQLTSGGPMRALRARFIKRRLQLISVLSGRQRADLVT